MPTNNKDKTHMQYTALSDSLTRKNDGLSVSQQDKILNLDVGNDTRNSALEKLTRSYDKPEDSSIVTIQGKHDGDDIRSLITQLLDSNDFKEMVAGGINNITSEKVREQRYLRQFMPQIAKSIDAMVTSIVSPNTQTNESIDLKLLSGVTSLNLIKKKLADKKIDDIVRECIQAALDHGVSYMYIYEYKDMAKDIIDIARSTQKGELDGINTNHRRYNEEISLISNADKGDNSLLFSESYGDTGETVIGSKLFSESLRINNTPELYSGGTSIKDTYFSESPVLFNATSAFKNKADILMKENKDSKLPKNVYSTKYLNKIEGCYVERLDNERCIPVYINKHLVGLYYVEDEFQNIMKQVQQQKGKLRDDITQKANLSMRVKEEIVKILYDEIDERFLANNKHVLTTIDSLLRDVKRANTQFRIRFISAEHITEFANFHRQSQMVLVEALAHCWIMLFKNYVFTDLFYKKDKIVTYYNTEYDDDIGSQGYRLLDTIRNMSPLPSDILNLRKMYMGMISSQRLLIPMTKNTKPFEIERIEGQKDSDNQFENLIRIQNIVTELIGFGYNMLDPSANADFALQILQADRNKAEMILSLQKRFKPAITDAYNKICKYEFNTDTSLSLDVKFFEVREVKQQIFAEQLSKISERIDLLKKYMIGDNEEDLEKVRFFERRMFEVLAPMYINIDEIKDVIAEYDIWKKTQPQDHSDIEEAPELGEDGSLDTDNEDNKTNDEGEEETF